MKVKVISSRHSHITPGMVGDANAFNWNVPPETQVQVEFPDVISPVPWSTIKPRTVTVMMLRKELQACN